MNVKKSRRKYILESKTQTHFLLVKNEDNFYMSPGKNIQFNLHTGLPERTYNSTHLQFPRKNIQFNPHTGSRKEHTIQPTYSSPEVIYFNPLIIPWKEHTIQPTYGSPERTYNSTHIRVPGKNIQFNPNMVPQKKTYNLTHIRVPGKNTQFNPHTGPWKEQTIQPKYGSPEKNI